MAEGTEVGTAYVSIVPSAAGFGTKLEGLIAGEASQVGTKAGQALSAGVTSSTGGLARSVAGIFAGVGAGGFFRGALGEAEEAAKVGNLTAAVIKSTGGAAEVSADQVDQLAQSLSKMAGIDDEVIQGAENVLLTFRSVGHDVFPQAIKAALDMSAALGTDLQGSVIQLGKALNDPLQGMLALRRVGVSFTEDQQAQIKALQQSGDLLGAQRLILAELNAEFGGAAAAGATATAKLDTAFKNLEESLGTALLPMVSGAASSLDLLVGGFTRLPGPVQTAAGAMLAIGTASLTIGLLAPKLKAATLELQAMGTAGELAATSIGLIGKAAGVAATIAILVPVFQSLNKQLDNAPDRVKQLAKVTDEQLGRAIIRDKDFQAVLKAGDFGLAQRILALGAATGDPMTKWQDAYDKAIGTQHQFNKDQALSAQLITDTGDALDTTSPKVASFAQQWEDLNGKLADLVATDWSKQLGSNLESAINPLERFTAAFGANAADLRTQAATAKADMDQANADLAKLSGTQTAAEIAQIRGKTGDLESARAKAQEATAKWKKINTDLAEAEKTPLTQIRQNLKANVDLLSGWLSDITKLSSAGFKGGHETLAKDLAALGPEAAGALHEALGLSPKQLDDLQGLFAQRDKLVGDAVSGQFEFNVDQAAKPGETLAQILVDRYKTSLVPKLTQATLAALNQATAAILTGNLPGLAAVPGISPGVAGPPAPGAVLFPGITPGVAGPPSPTATAGVTVHSTVQVQTNANPQQISGAVGDNLAWRLRGSGPFPGSGW